MGPGQAWGGQRDRRGGKNLLCRERPSPTPPLPPLQRLGSWTPSLASATAVQETVPSPDAYPNPSGQVQRNKDLWNCTFWAQPALFAKCVWCPGDAFVSCRQQVLLATEKWTSTAGVATVPLVVSSPHTSLECPEVAEANAL